jgi:hypothetical protein
MLSFLGQRRLVQKRSISLKLDSPLEARLQQP